MDVSLKVAADRIRDDVAEKGWSYLPRWYDQPDGGARLVELASGFGLLVSHGEVDGVPQVLTVTRCDETAPTWEPFNRPEPIGWHNDYSTWANRPDLSFAWVMSSPPVGQARGDWRVASCDDVIAHLRRTDEGRRALRLLISHDLPFHIADDEPIHLLRVLTGRGDLLQVRYYENAIRRGLTLHGDQNRDVAHALAIWSAAADAAGAECFADRGALLVCHNWRAMHARAPQGVGRSTVLCATTDSVDMFFDMRSRERHPP